MTEAWMRQITSQLSAQQYLVGVLLRSMFVETGADSIPELAAIIKAEIKQIPEAITGVFEGNDFLAERYSDMAVMMHEWVDRSVDDAADKVLTLLRAAERR